MICTYKKMIQAAAKRIRLVMSDVDDTLTSSDGKLAPAVKEAIRSLRNAGIGVGLISGRNIRDLAKCAAELGVDGPIIAENGGLVRLRRNGPIHILGRQREAATALFKLKSQFGDKVKSGDWNNDRTTDLILSCENVTVSELKRHIGDLEIIPTSYFYGRRFTVHLLKKGLNKGNVLRLALGHVWPGVGADRTMVLGDGLNDISMFRLFQQGVLIPNVNQPEQNQKALLNSARYIGGSAGGEGFAEVANHIIEMRLKAA